MMLRPLVLLLCIASVTPITCTAQNDECYRAIFTGALAPAQLKSLVARSPALVGNGKWEFNEATSTLELRLRSALSRESFQAWASELGLIVSEYEHLQGGAASTTHGRFFNHPDFPVFLDTGDNIADNERYEQEKNTWIATHPEAYQEMTAPAVVPDQTQAK